ncbi:hypothetical protein SteCoe_5693 [Stentor coeruleus]|uniref:Uncharacterized protein n=1 Tax=Stentor coeruleus TaxID=5963 RepID=A0A1R2CRN0_9CILI|nr:hypothetical protein SteCoe_5693 [Stentor coeruleus]
MFNKHEIESLIASNPDKSNANPWNPGSTIKCEDFMKKYQDCIQNQDIRGEFIFKSKCLSYHKLAGLCYKLEPRHFINATKEELEEDAYLDRYIASQTRFNKKPEVLKMKK